MKKVTYLAKSSVKRDYVTIKQNKTRDNYKIMRNYITRKAKYKQGLTTASVKCGENLAVACNNPLLATLVGGIYIFIERTLIKLIRQNELVLCCIDFFLRFIIYCSCQCKLVLFS